ncbi:MAG TPA: signal peptidase I [Candidatus Stackebrandtia faecavium]|nr:signal peptidase I [Candidatus Stackebrandtia faecavium]
MPEKETDDEESTETKSSFWRELPVLLAVALVVALIVRSFVLQSYWIPSGSMENTLQRDDRVLVNKLLYDFSEADRGEVVVFHAPMEWRSDPENEDFIKRIIAVGGDTVSYDKKTGKIAVNGKSLDESAYIYKNGDGEQDLPSRNNFEFSATIPEGRLWVMGDHRSASGDSLAHYIRSNGDIGASTISQDALVGKAMVLMWPFSRWDWITVPATFDTVPEPNANQALSP